MQATESDFINNAVLDRCSTVVLYGIGLDWVGRPGGASIEHPMEACGCSELFLSPDIHFFFRAQVFLIVLIRKRQRKTVKRRGGQEKVGTVGGMAALHCC